MAAADYPYRSKCDKCEVKPIDASVRNYSAGVLKEEDYLFSTRQNDRQCEFSNRKINASIDRYYCIQGPDQYAAYLHEHGSYCR